VATLERIGPGGPELVLLDESRGRLSIGKQADNDLVIDGDGAVSRVHAKLERVGPAWCVTDVGSTNGTMINGARLIAGDTRALADRDEIIIGRTRLVLHDHGAGGEGTTEPVRHAPQLTKTEKLVLIDRPTLTMPGYRFELARQYAGPSYLAIDDDVLLRVKQIRRLSDEFAERPETPCGTQGAVLIARTRLDEVCVTRARDWPFRRATPHDASPDILNGVYMFAPAHLETYFRQCRLLAIEDQARFGNGEDIVLSHCGAWRPRKIEVGPRLRCMSSGMPGIAISMSRRDAFFAERWRIFRALRSQNPNWSA